MTEQSIIATQKIADFLNELMADKKITTYKLQQLGIHPNDINSVLRRGNHKNANYTINTLLKITNAIGLDICFNEIC